MIAAVGNVALDLVGNGERRPGGTVFYAALALARLGAPARVAAACAARDRDLLVTPLETSGLPVTWYASGASTTYRYRYVGERREMWQEAVGDPWAPAQACEAAGDAGWVHVGALVRTEFPCETLAALAEDRRRLLVDAQGLVRAPTLGPLRMERPARGALRAVSILKVAEEEARVLAGTAEPHALRVLDLPEVLLTLGARGCVVVTSNLVEHVPASPLADVPDPTGAGDTFAAAYLVARARGAEPVEAAGFASEVTADFLAAR